MTRETAIAEVGRLFDGGAFLATLAGRISHESASPEPDAGPRLRGYLLESLQPDLVAMGFSCRVIENPVAPKAPFLYAERIEPDAPLTVLTYGHGDVVPGMDAAWREGLSPWKLTPEGDRLYGRGTADNKGQHSINLAALQTVLAVRGHLGFSVKALYETGEEIGSPGLAEVAEAERDLLAADLLIASDGPRLTAERPTLFLGSRGALNFDLVVDLRQGGHHSGNWGGLLASPGTVLANALAAMVDARGRILVEGWRPEGVPASIRDALATVEPRDDPSGEPRIDPDWGEPGLSLAEKVYAWPSFEVLACITGDPERPANAIPPFARAHCGLRTTADLDHEDLLPALRRHLDQAGFAAVEIRQSDQTPMRATRLLPDHPLVQWAAASLARTTGQATTVLPNLGGSLPNEVFARTLGLPTIWVPHSYPGCSQHAPNEHLLAPVVREGLTIMVGLFWDLGADAAILMEEGAKR